MAKKPMPTIGVDFYHYAPVLYNADDGLVYDTAVRVEGQTEMSHAANSQSNAFYADNYAYISDTSLGNQEVTTTHADIPNDVFSDMIGGNYNGALSLSGNFIAKQRGCLFRILRSGGHYRYYRFWNGTYTVPDRAATTKGESIDYQTQQVVYTAVNVSTKDSFLQIIDDDDQNVLDMGITPAMLEEMIVDFNWDPFNGLPEFASQQRLAVSPSVIAASATDGTVARAVLLGLTSGEFASTIQTSDITATNLPTGLAIGDVTLLASNTVQIEISGAASSHTSADTVHDVTLEVSQSAIEDAAAALTTKPLTVEFK